MKEEGGEKNDGDKEECWQVKVDKTVQKINKVAEKFWNENEEVQQTVSELEKTAESWFDDIFGDGK